MGGISPCSFILWRAFHRPPKPLFSWFVGVTAQVQAIAHTSYQSLVWPRAADMVVVQKAIEQFRPRLASAAASWGSTNSQYYWWLSILWLTKTGSISQLNHLFIIVTITCSVKTLSNIAFHLCLFCHKIDSNKVISWLKSKVPLSINFAFLPITLLRKTSFWVYWQYLQAIQKCLPLIQQMAAL